MSTEPTLQDRLVASLKATRTMFEAICDAADIDNDSSIRARSKTTGEVLAERTIQEVFDEADALLMEVEGGEA